MPIATDEDSADEDPLERDQDWGDDVDLIGCPFCKGEIADDAELCPHCGNFIIRDESSMPIGRRVLIACVVVVMIIAAIFVL